MKTETCKLYSRDFLIFLPNIIKIDPYNFELYRFKVGPFFETQCRMMDWLSDGETILAVCLAVLHNTSVWRTDRQMGRILQSGRTIIREKSGKGYNLAALLSPFPYFCSFTYVTSPLTCVINNLIKCGWLIGNRICAFDWYQDLWPWVTFNCHEFKFLENFAGFCRFGR